MRTHILQQYGSPKSCSALFQSLIKENSQGLGLYPTSHTVSALTTLRRTLQSNWSYNSLNDFIKSGIYSDARLKMHIMRCYTNTISKQHSSYGENK